VSPLFCCTSPKGIQATPPTMYQHGSQDEVEVAP
jgi:hypothetical protein